MFLMLTPAARQWRKGLWGMNYSVVRVGQLKLTGVNIFYFQSGEVTRIKRRIRITLPAGGSLVANLGSKQSEELEWQGSDIDRVTLQLLSDDIDAAE